MATVSYGALATSSNLGKIILRCRVQSLGFRGFGFGAQDLVFRVWGTDAKKFKSTYASHKTRQLHHLTFFKRDPARDFEQIPEATGPSSFWRFRTDDWVTIKDHFEKAGYTTCVFTHGFVCVHGRTCGNVHRALVARCLWGLGLFSKPASP